MSLVNRICMCVCVCECVCVCVSEREREREECVKEKENVFKRLCTVGSVGAV